MDNSDGYSSFAEYFEDNQTEWNGKIKSKITSDYEGPVLVELNSSSEVLPSLKEALELSELASNPSCGGYTTIVLSETNKEVTCQSADDWLFN
jgi:hypothetical protein